jgi:hypothetical protein
MIKLKGVITDETPSVEIKAIKIIIELNKLIKISISVIYLPIFLLLYLLSNRLLILVRSFKILLPFKLNDKFMANGKIKNEIPVNLLIMLQIINLVLFSFELKTIF